LFAQELARLGSDLAEAGEWKAEFWELAQLTPGDFAAVVRQYQLWDETPSAREFYHRLCVEVAAKRKEQRVTATETRTTGRRTTNYA
jgi:protein subunit release factor A